MGTPYIQFGNVRFTVGWSLDYQGGGSPSACTIRTIPHLDHLEQSGNLILGETGNGELVLRDCKLVRPFLTADRKWELTILDRRWKWAFGEIRGSYNIRRPDKSYIREKTPQQLAEILLLAMGERKGNWDISRLPNFSRPLADWNLKNPMQMFDDLVQSLGCEWTLDYFKDQVVVWPMGDGIDLPEGPTETRSLGYSASIKPDSIAVYGAPVLFQARFVCEAVAKDTDLKIKPLDQLTGYDPNDCDDPEEFKDIEGTYNDHGEEKDIADLAHSTVYRWYRITGLANGGWSPEELKGTAFQPASFWDLEFIDTRAEQEVDENEVGNDGQPTSRKVNKPAQVVARWYDSENDETPAEGDLKTYPGHFTVEPKLGLVRFSDPLYLLDDTATPTHKPAKVYVDVAFYAGRDGLHFRPFVETTTGEKGGTGSRIIVHDEIEERVIQNYSKTNLQNIISTPGDYQKQLRYYLDAALKDYDVLPSQTRTYHGLLPIVPDGRIRQVTWSGGDGKPASTKASLNTEHNSYVPTVDDTRRQQTITELLKIPAWQRTPDQRKLLTLQFG